VPCGRTFRRWRCPASSTTPDLHDRYRLVRVIHPFHPLSGQDFELVAYRQNWGEDRVHLHDESGQLFSLPAAWTDVAVPDPFVVVTAGRCPFTVDGLLAVTDLVPLEYSIAGLICTVTCGPGRGDGWLARCC
jgi:hypothetical protein